MSAKPGAGQASAQQSKENSNANAELLDVLRAIKVKVPGKLAGQDKELEMDLFTLVHNNRDTLISGVTNAMNSSEVESFFFYTIIPKLQAYGLADNQKEPGYKFRRASLNKKGQTFFAEIEKKILLAKTAAAKNATTEATAAKTMTDKGSRSPAVGQADNIDGQNAAKSSQVSPLDKKKTKRQKQP